MRFSNHGIKLLLLLVICVSVLLGKTVTAQDDKPFLRVMSFNIRLGVANDGDNHWEKRKDLVVKTVLNFQADLVGTQETWDFQAAFLRDQLKDFSYAGRSRQKDGKGEQCGILFRTARFDKLVEGHFWLSETPDEPGSKSWDSSLPRMVTWLKLWDREAKQSFYIVNTHFDHRGKQARKESASLIRKFVASLPADSKVIVTGDFNAAEKSAPYAALFDPIMSEPSPLIDSFRSSHPVNGNGEGTFNGFEGVDTGARIDWVAATRNVEVVSAGIDKSEFDGRYPSDHFPVTAVISLQPKMRKAKKNREVKSESKK